MARLPSRYDLGGPASFRSGKAIASYDTSAVGRGIEKFGADLSALGREQQQQENAVDVANAEAYKTEGLLGVQNQFENDPDYATFGKRAPAETGGVIGKAAALIRDPKMRARWQAGANADAVRVNDGIMDNGVKLKRSAETVAFDNALETNRRIYVDPTSSEDARAKAKTDIDGAIQTGLSTGLLSPEQADARRKVYVDNAEVSRYLLDAEVHPDKYVGGPSSVGPVGAIITEKANKYGVPPAIALGIAQIESGLNPNAKAGTSSAGGLFQFIDGTAEQYGLANKFNASDNADAGARFTRDNMDRLRKTLGREPTPGEVYLAHFSGVGAAEDLGRVPANTPTTEIFSAAAIRANRSILEGKTAGQVREWADRKMAAAIEKAGGGAYQSDGSAPTWAANMSPEDRMKVIDQARNARNKLNVERRGQIETIVDNAPAAIQNTGAYDGSLPDRQQFMDAYGPDDGSQRYDKFQAAVDVSQQAYDFRTMSAEEIQQAVADAAPTSSGNDAALETAKYQTLSNAAETTLKARTADPSGYAQQVFPAVGQAWEQAQTTGDYKPAMTLMAAAQQQLGIANPELLPKAVAEGSVSKFKDENTPETERIGSIAGLVFSTSDPAQRVAVFNQLVKAGLPDITAGAIRATARGDQGAAQRLFQAAMTDISKLPGQNPEGMEPSKIDAAIQSQLMDVNKIGDVYYGLSDGSAENLVAAQRDSKLMANAVTLRVRKGENLDSAVNAVAKDLFGDVKPVSGANVSILIPSDQDEGTVLSGLDAMQPRVRAMLEQTLAVPADVKGANTAILEATRQNEIQRLMLDGYWRNSGNGYVFLDPMTGNAVADENGNPMVIPETDVLAAGNGKSSAGAIGQTQATPTNQFNARTPDAGAGPSLDEQGNPVVLGQ